MFPGYQQPRMPDPEILSAYVDHPWARLSTFRRAAYDPYLYQMYRSRSVYSQYVTHRMNLSDQRTMEMYITEMYDIHPNFNELDFRQMTSPTSGIDTRQRRIQFKRYGNSMNFHKFDPMVTWFTNAGGVEGYKAIIMSQFGNQMTTVMDRLARNAMFQMPFTLQPSGTKMGDLTGSDKMTTPLINEIYTQFLYRRVPYITGGPAQNGIPGTIACLTTPGVIQDIQNQVDPADWKGVMAYADPSRLLVNEVGTWRNVRFVSTDENILWNMGAKEVQVAVSSAIKEGDGASANVVDTVWTVGQPNSTHYIQLAATDVDSNTVDGTYMNAHFKANDYLTLHVTRTSDFGVTNGPDFRDGRLVTLRIAEIDATNRRISFTDPILQSFETDLTGGGVYAYVTKGLHVHVSLFIGGSDAVMMGVGDPPRIYIQEPIDRYKSMWTISWDMFAGYQPWNPYVVTPVFTSGLVSIFGQALQP